MLNIPMFKRQAKNCCNKGSPANDDKPKLYLRGTNSMPFEYEILPLEQQHPELRAICMGIVHDSKGRYVESVQSVVKNPLPLSAFISSIVLYFGFNAIRSSCDPIAAYISSPVGFKDSGEAKSSYDLYSLLLLGIFVLCKIGRRIIPEISASLENIVNNPPYGNERDSFERVYRKYAPVDPDKTPSLQDSFNSLFMKSDIMTARLSKVIHDLVDREERICGGLDASELLSKFNYIKVNDRGDLIFYKDYRSQFAQAPAFYRIPLLWLQMHQPFQRNHSVLHKVVKRDRKPKPTQRLQLALPS